MITVHIVFNAHLDPVWLWSWKAGLDEVLNSTYYICDLLDRHPDIVYTRGEAWIYEQISRVDPSLFERVRNHVKAGRWSTVGGWYIQPDCNLPSGFAMERQIELGRQKFCEYFGAFPKVAYNVDSFGHSAALPDLMREAGQEYYVMMRPMRDEMALPARIFRWRGHAGGREVVTFRLANYCTLFGLSEQNIHDALSELPEGVTQTMAFIGVGDHGGGPTEEMVEWCRSHRHSFPGVELVFSSPEKFFAAIEPEVSKLPEVIGELQMHAVGCYSVHRSIKTAVRQAEHRLVQAEWAIRSCRTPAAEDTVALDAAWRRVCFHHFHDTMGGTCIRSAYVDVDAQLGSALTTADELATYALREHVSKMEENPAQRIFLLNASDRAFDDYTELEPWLMWTGWQPSWRLVDEDGEAVNFQLIETEALVDLPGRLVFPVVAGPGQLRTFRIVDSGHGAPSKVAGVSVHGHEMKSPDGVAVRVEEGGRMDLQSVQRIQLPRLALYDDRTDTWSHGTARYARENQENALWQETQIMDEGPVMASLVQQGTIGHSEVRAEWRIYLGKPWVECLLRVRWMEKFRVLKFEWDLPGEIGAREDGIMKGSLIRENDGMERPFRDWTRMPLKEGNKSAGLAVIAPEVFAFDCEPGKLGLTLLRSPAMAWHEPNPGTSPRGVFSDCGEHFFRFRFLAGDNLAASWLDDIAYGWQRPLIGAELTHGMRNVYLRGGYEPARMG